ncbi:restriction endonuclease [Candidatus Woesearchaeota archaeon CG08_land_8_20_14_0_20_47_9]|nr:MAG: restriction endonuclease [Candidatus Woesearchaeota archaeon CG08_land_8_20_14_0_20_47_9]HII29542.1 restriction endonuclease [Candidatus Woesearchaeota archaeon]
MRILAVYSFNRGEEVIKKRYMKEFEEINTVIAKINAGRHLSKQSKEKTMLGAMLYSPISMNKAFKKEFLSMGWKNHKITCNYPARYYVNGYTPSQTKNPPYRDMDFVKNKLGVEVQFGKYSFMIYNVCAKMTIFHNLGIIDAGIEIVPIKELAQNMSTGVSYFEQLVWDLEQRGVSNIDIPALILGIGANVTNLGGNENLLFHAPRFDTQIFGLNFRPKGRGFKPGAKIE